MNLQKQTNRNKQQQNIKNTTTTNNNKIQLVRALSTKQRMLLSSFSDSNSDMKSTQHKKTTHWHLL